MMRLVKIIIFLAAIIYFLPGYAAAQQAKENPVIGTWKLVSIMQERVPAGAKTPYAGGKPVGYLHYAADGHMIVLIVKGDRKKPQGKFATPQEAAALFESMTSYAGTYTVKGNEVTHHVDASWNQSWTGTKKVRSYQFNGKYLVLTVPSFVVPKLGKMSIILTWKKIS